MTNKLILLLSILLVYIVAAEVEEKPHLRGRNLATFKKCVRKCRHPPTNSATTPLSKKKCRQICREGKQGKYENGDFDGPEDGQFTAAQKRQWKRDGRRFKNRPHRTHREEHREHLRKKEQAKRRGNPFADPTVGGDKNIESMREKRRHFKCANSKNKAGCYFNHHSDAKNVDP